MSDDAIRYDLKWTPPLLREVYYLHYTTRRDGAKKIPAWLRFVLAVIVGALIGFGIGFMQIPLPKWLVWLVIGFGVGILVWGFYYRWAVGRWARREGESPLRQGVTAVELSPEGIRAAHPLSDSVIRWPALLAMREGPSALHLMVSENFSLPVPDEVLPSGLSRAEVRRRVEAWRSGA